MVCMAKAKKKNDDRGRSMTIWLDPELMDALEAFLARQRFPSSKTGVIETLLRELLQREGLIEGGDAKPGA